MGLDSQLMCGAVKQAGAGQAEVAQAAANSIALLRTVVSAPTLRGPMSTTAALAAVLLSTLQHAVKANAPACLLLVQWQVVRLEQELLGDASATVHPPQPPGILQPGPPREGGIAGGVEWYSLQQALLCALQVRSLGGIDLDELGACVADVARCSTCRQPSGSAV